MKEEQVPKGIG